MRGKRCVYAMRTWRRLRNRSCTCNPEPWCILHPTSDPATARARRWAGIRKDDEERDDIQALMARSRGTRSVRSSRKRTRGRPYPYSKAGQTINGEGSGVKAAPFLCVREAARGRTGLHRKGRAAQSLSHSISRLADGIVPPACQGRTIRPVTAAGRLNSRRSR